MHVIIIIIIIVIIIVIIIAYFNVFYISPDLFDYDGHQLI